MGDNGHRNGRKLTIFLVGSQPILHKAIRQALDGDDIEIAGESSLRSDVWFQLDELSPNIVIVDVEPPKGFVVARQIRVHCPGVAVVMMSTNPDDNQLFRALEEGAAALVDKATVSDNLADILKRVGDGEYPINDALATRPEAAKKVLNQFHRVFLLSEEAKEFMKPLSPRETEVLKYIAEGFSNKRIGYVLSLGEQTVKNYVASIMRKLNANGRAHAVVLALRRGLIDIEESPPSPEGRATEKDKRLQRV